MRTRTPAPGTPRPGSPGAIPPTAPARPGTPTGTRQHYPALQPHRKTATHPLAPENRNISRARLLRTARSRDTPPIRSRTTGTASQSPPATRQRSASGAGKPRLRTGGGEHLPRHGTIPPASRPAFHDQITGRRSFTHATCCIKHSRSSDSRPPRPGRQSYSYTCAPPRRTADEPPERPEERAIQLGFCINLHECDSRGKTHGRMRHADDRSRHMGASRARRL